MHDSTHSVVLRSWTPLIPLLSILVHELRMYPQKLATFVLDTDQAAEAVRLVFCSQQRMQFPERRAFGEHGVCAVKRCFIIAGKPIADLLPPLLRSPRHTTCQTITGLQSSYKPPSQPPTSLPNRRSAKPGSMYWTGFSGRVQTSSPNLWSARFCRRQPSHRRLAEAAGAVNAHTKASAETSQ